MGRGMMIVVLSAAVVGSVGGGLTALRLAPPSRKKLASLRMASDGTAQAAASPAPPTENGSATTLVTTSASQPNAPAVQPAPHAAVTVQIKSLLSHIADWSRDHAGAPCPDVAALGVRAIDPWGHPLVITCTDQPADQTVGVMSSGPDGLFGTMDDIPSWTLGAEVTTLIHGPRWGPTAITPARTTRTTQKPRPSSNKAARAISPRGLEVLPTPPALSSSSSPGSAPNGAELQTTHRPENTRTTPPIDAGDDIPNRRSPK
jgi:hypothetical protein